MTSMKKYVCLIILLVIFGCQENKETCFDSKIFLSEFVKGLSKELPPANSHIFFFLRLKDGRIVKINNIGLYDLYNDRYKNDYSFKMFLCSLFKENLVLSEGSLINKNYKYSVFRANSGIEKTDIEVLKNKFCRGKGDTLMLNNNLSEEDQLTILYVFFKNLYYVSFDDYSGYYFINVKI